MAADKDVDGAENVTLSVSQDFPLKGGKIFLTYPTRKNQMKT
jgi:hypothetical protein